METLPIFLDRLLNPVAAIIISVTAILVFGEILPQVRKLGVVRFGRYWLHHAHLCMLSAHLGALPGQSGMSPPPQAVCKRYGLQIGAYFSYLVRFLMLFTGLITWPIGAIMLCSGGPP